MLPVRAIIFDLFGTLVTYPQGAPHVRAMAEKLDVAFEALHPPWRKLRAKRDAGDLDSVGSLRECCDELGIQRSDEQLEAACAGLTEFFCDVLIPREGALSALAMLRDRGFRLGLLSDTNIEVPRLWPRSPLARYIDAAVFSSLEHVRKPDPRLYRSVCERLHTAPSDCLYVGNGDGNELAGATKTGMRALLFTAPGESAGHEAATWQGPRISRLTDVVSFIDRERTSRWEAAEAGGGA